MARRKRTGGPAFSLFAFQDIITCVMGIMLLLTLMLSLQIEEAPGAQMASKVNDRAKTLEAESRRLLNEIDEMELQLSIQLASLNSGAMLDPALLSQSRDRAVREAIAAQQESARVSEIVVSSRKQLEDIRLRFAELSQVEEESATLDEIRRKRHEELEDIRSGRKRVYNGHESNSKSCWLIEMSSPVDIRIAKMGNEESSTQLQGIEELIEWVETQQKEDTALMLLVKPDAANSLEPLSKALSGKKLPFGFDLLPQDSDVLKSAEANRP